MGLPVTMTLRLERRWGMPLAVALVFAAALQPAAASETGPVIVVPGRAGVPVLLNGYDISGTVVEGDWGLARPSNINPTVIYRVRPHPYILPEAKHYFPGTGRHPGYGRKEAEPPPDRATPAPAKSFERSWNSQSDPNPVTIMPPWYDVPPVIVAPQIGRDRPPRPPTGP